MPDASASTKFLSKTLPEPVIERWSPYHQAKQKPLVQVMRPKESLCASRLFPLFAAQWFLN